MFLSVFSALVVRLTSNATNNLLTLFNEKAFPLDTFSANLYANTVLLPDGEALPAGVPQRSFHDAGQGSDRQFRG